VRRPAAFPPSESGFFLVERYLPLLDEAALEALGSRLAAAASELRRDGVEVRWLGSTALPEEESCFCIFLAPNRNAVEAANELAGACYERILRARHIGRETPVGVAER
jgi:hypothetical protein